MQTFKKGLIFILLAFCACKSDIIPSRKMVPILVKIYLSDASIMNSNTKVSLFKKDTIEYYAPIIESYGYTTAQFDSSINYYGSKPKELDAIMDKVIFELSKAQSDLEQKQRADDSLSVDTSKNLWNLKPYYEIKLDMPQDIISFDIPVVGLGTYSISYNIQVFPDDEAIKPQLKAYFFYDDKTESGNISQYIEIPYVKDGEKRDFKTSLVLNNSLVTSIKGYLLDYNNTDRKFRNHAIISDIKVKFKPAKDIEGRLKKREIPRNKQRDDLK